MRLWPLRDFADDAYRRVDDRPYGGGPGMVMLAEPLERALAAIRAARAEAAPAPVVHFTPTGRRIDQALVREFAARAGRGAAVRPLRRHRPALHRPPRRPRAEPRRLRAVGRRTAGAGAARRRRAPAGRRARRRRSRTSRTASSDGLLDCPHYSRPERAGDGDASRRCRRCCCRATMPTIARWRRERSLELTARRRPDLIAAARAAGRLERAPTSSSSPTLGL